MNEANFLPAFPPKNFSKENSEKFIDLAISSELEELKKVREILKPHLKKIPREYKTVSQRVKYFIDRE